MTIHQNGYELVKKVIDNNLLRYINTIIDLHEYVETGLNQNKNSQYPFNDDQIQQCFAWYGSYHSEAMLIYLRPIIEKVVGLELLPTYSYYRTYFQGSDLKPHKDRVSCQYSATLCLHKDSVPWPIKFEKNDGGTAEYDLAAGDMLVYKGIDYTHWREPFKGTKQKQMFLHYVDRNGPYAKTNIYDGRPYLALNKKPTNQPAVTQNPMNYFLPDNLP